MALLPAATGMMRGLAIAARAIAAVVEHAVAVSVDEARTRARTIAAVVAHTVAVSVDEVHAADKLSHASTDALRGLAGLPRQDAGNAPPPWNMQCRSPDAAPDCAATATAGTASVATSAVLNAKSAILLLFI